MSGQQDIRVLVTERDIYARQAIVSYLSWDRNTRVVDHVGTAKKMFTSLGNAAHPGYIDAIILDTKLATTPEYLEALVREIIKCMPGISVICLTDNIDLEMILSARSAGACAYLTREQVGIGIAPAVRFAIQNEFVITRDIISLLAGRLNGRRDDIQVLPRRRRYPRLTQRVEQALWLCVVEGLPAELAADEMGVSVSTVRSYIKEGYRVLEAADDTAYPTSMSPAERAFQRYIALDWQNVATETQTMWEPAA